MIKVTVGSNFTQKVFENVDESTATVRSILDQGGVDYNRFTVHMNGDVVTSDKLDRTFAQNGVYEDCYLMSTTKADSAM